jgi:hypothetical protein
LANALQDLEKKHDDYATATNNTLNNDIKGDGWISGTTLASHKSAIDEINNKLKDIESGAQVNDLESIKIQLGTPSATDNVSITNKKATITVPGSLSHLSDGNRVGSVETSINNINNAIGTKQTNHAATNGKTIYKAIEDEYNRAIGAE